MTVDVSRRSACHTCIQVQGQIQKFGKGGGGFRLKNYFLVFSAQFTLKIYTKNLHS